MSDDDALPERDPAPGARRSPRFLLGAILVLLIAGVVGIVAFASVGGTPEADRAGDSAPSASPTEQDRGDAEEDGPGQPDASAPDAGEQQAERTVADFLTVASSPIPAQEVAGSGALHEVATGGILSEIQAEILELEANEWVKDGAPQVVWTKAPVTDPASPGRSTVEACVDSSSVTLTTRAGEPVSTNTTPRAINIFTLESDGTATRVVARTFPDDPAC